MKKQIRYQDYNSFCVWSGKSSLTRHNKPGSLKSHRLIIHQWGTLYCSPCFHSQSTFLVCHLPPDKSLPITRLHACHYDQKYVAALDSLPCGFTTALLYLQAPSKGDLFLSFPHTEIYGRGHSGSLLPPCIWHKTASSLWIALKGIFKRNWNCVWSRENRTNVYPLSRSLWYAIFMAT